MSAPFTQSRDGRAFDLLGIDPVVLDIEEAVHSLARLNRYAGHTRGPVAYNVAHHSVLVSLNSAEGEELDGLCHDLHEAIVGDCSSPVKLAMKVLNGGKRTPWDDLEDSVASRVRIGLGLSPKLPASVEEADLRAVLTERRDLLGDFEVRPWGVPGVAWAERIVPMTAKEAERYFLDRFAELRQKAVA